MGNRKRNGQKRNLSNWNLFYFILFYLFTYGYQLISYVILYVRLFALECDRVKQWAFRNRISWIKKISSFYVNVRIADMIEWFCEFDVQCRKTILGETIFSFLVTSNLKILHVIRWWKNKIWSLIKACHKTNESFQWKLSMVSLITLPMKACHIIYV